MQYELNKQVLQIVQNLSSALNNYAVSKANNISDDLTTMLKCRNKLIKTADRSIVGWETVAEYEADPIASDSANGKAKILTNLLFVFLV